MIQVADRSLSKARQTTSKSDKMRIDIECFVAATRQCGAKICHRGLPRCSCVNAGSAKELLGHTHQQTTEIYLRGFEVKEVDPVRRETPKKPTD
ncbi:hypothetical protein [Propionivibrio sp.]|uniref:hypothetical protein n=1 Tax=Propionivibrio sp. TaxID=2212460 RepID=UPI003BF220AE